MLQNLPDYIVKLDRDKVYALVKQALAAGEDPLKIIEFAQKGMEIVGEKFNSGEYYLAELMLSGKIFQTLVDELNPLLTQKSSKKKVGKIMLAAPEGDIHDLGKNIVATTFSAHGWEVFDLGVNVPAATIVSEIVAVNPDVLGLSCLLTTAFDNMKKTVELLKEKGLRDDISLVIGGGVTNESTREFVGADFQCTDVIVGLDFCMEKQGVKRNA